MFRIADSLLLPLQAMENHLLMWKESISYLYWKVPKMMALTKLCFLCLTVAFMAGRQELSWEPQAPAWWLKRALSGLSPPSFAPSHLPLPKISSCQRGKKSRPLVADFVGPGEWQTIWKRTNFSQAGELGSDLSFNLSPNSPGTTAQINPAWGKSSSMQSLLHFLLPLPALNRQCKWARNRFESGKREFWQVMLYFCKE